MSARVREGVWGRPGGGGGLAAVGGRGGAEALQPGRVGHPIGDGRRPMVGVTSLVLLASMAAAGEGCQSRGWW